MGDSQMPKEPQQSETPTPRTDELLAQERHQTVAETRYWLDQLKLLSRTLERECAELLRKVGDARQQRDEIGLKLVTAFAVVCGRGLKAREW